MGLQILRLSPLSLGAGPDAAPVSAARAALLARLFDFGPEARDTCADSFAAGGECLAELLAALAYALV